jgi:hypothetical protein
MRKKNHQKFKQFLIANPSLIHQLTVEGMGNFMLFYLSHLFRYQFGIFQLFMLIDLESKVKNLVYPTFPDSYAEEIFMYSYVLWSVLGINKFTNCVIVCGTREKAKEVYTRFKNEFLYNDQLKKFNHKVSEASCDGWNIFVPGFNARISILAYPIFPSRIRHKRRSPDVVICCDLDESLADVGSITSWMGDQLYDERHFYHKTIVFGTVRKQSNIFEEIRMRGVQDKRKKFNVLIVPCPLFGEEKDCLWDKRYSKKEINEMLANWNNEEWQRQYLLHTYDTHKVPRKYFDADGVCRIDDYLKDIEKNDDFFIERIFIKVDRERHAETYSILGGNYEYYGTGKVVKYEPVD